MSVAAPNRNTYHARVFVDGLVRAGLEAVCIAPGSRSTPLTLAFAERDDVRLYSHLDERSAAFFALGLAMATDKPVAMVCTSGTAAANFHPAIIEAYMSRVPLLVLTADRPPELRHSGANQTIVQVKMYGDHVLWAVDMALPEGQPPAVAVRNYRLMAARAFATANGRMEYRRKGPVHLNFPFRKPLEPVEVDGDVMPDDAKADVRFESIGETEPDGEQTEWVKRFREHERGVVICGAGRADVTYLDEIARFAAAYGYPILAEPLSGMRFREGNSSGAEIVSGYDNFMAALPDEMKTPDVIVRFGAVPTSKALNTFVAEAGAKYIVTVTWDGVWRDDAHLTTHQLHLRRPEQLLSQNSNEFRSHKSSWLRQWLEVNSTTRRHIDAVMEGPFFDGGAISAFVQWILSEDFEEAQHLFVGNSSPIRHIEQFVPAGNHTLHVHGSRGASGIDGQVSTALGVGAGAGTHIYAILGDITFYHDMNGLLAVRRNGISGTFLVINNNGGGIFERLPIRQFEPYHTDQFLTPHGLTYEHAAAMYGLDYARVDSFDALNTALETHAQPGHSALIEVMTDIRMDDARRKAFVGVVREAVAEMLRD